MCQTPHEAGFSELNGACDVLIVKLVAVERQFFQQGDEARGYK